MEYAPENEPTEPVQIHDPVVENSLSPAEAKTEVVGEADRIAQQSSAPQQESLSGQRRRRKQRSENGNLVSCSTDISYQLQQHMLLTATNSDFCVLGVNCLEAQNDDNLKNFLGIGQGRSLSRSAEGLSRTRYYCNVCRNENGGFVFACKMCFMLVHAQNDTWVIGPNTCALARLINTRKHGIQELKI